MISSTLRVQLFGAARMHIGQQPIANFPTAKARLLFFYLLVFHRDEHPRSVLQGIFWGDRSDERARHSLRTELWRTRQWLKSLPGTTGLSLVNRDEQICLQVKEDCWLDTEEFEKSIKRANHLQVAAPDQAAAALREAVDLYGGNLLEGFYDEWCLTERERLENLYLDALTRLMVFHAERREYGQAIPYAQRILREEPLREDIHRELIKFYANSRQVSQAIAQYQTCETILDRELHVAPEPETQRLFHSLMAGQYPASRIVSPGSSAGLSRKERDIALLTLRVQNALTQLEATRRELDEALSQMEQPRQDPGDRSRPSQGL